MLHKKMLVRIRVSTFHNLKHKPLFLDMNFWKVHIQHSEENQQWQFTLAVNAEFVP